MKLRVIASVALGAVMTFGVACSGGEEASEPTEASAGDDDDQEDGQDDDDKDADDDGAAQATTAPAEEAPVAAEVPEAPVSTPEVAPVAAPAAVNFQGEKVVRYVTAFALNVRSEPSREARVVRHVKFGEKLEVVINGEWAQLGLGEFIAVTRLSETPPATKTWVPGGSKKSSKSKK